MSVGALLSSVRPSSESLNLRMILGIPEHIYIAIYIFGIENILCGFC